MNQDDAIKIAPGAETAQFKCPRCGELSQSQYYIGDKKVLRCCCDCLREAVEWVFHRIDGAQIERVRNDP